MRFAVRLVSALFVFALTGCAESPEMAATDEARDDLGCDDVVVRTVDPEPSIKACPPMVVSVQGCGRYATYVCRPGVRDCDYGCRRTSR